MSRTFLTGAASGEPAVVIRLKDVGALVKAQGGPAGAAAYSVAPQAIEAKVYETVAEKLREGFKGQAAGYREATPVVPVDVQVTTAPPTGPAPAGKRDFLTGMVFGGATVVGGYLLYKHVVARFVVPFLQRSFT